MRVFILLVYVVTAHVGIATSQSIDIKGECYRYMVFRGSPFAELRGRYPVRVESIGHGRHFRFYRDENGLVTRIEHWINNKMSEGGYNRFGALASAAVLEIERVDSLEIRNYLDASGNPMENFWGVAVEQIVRDDQGYKKSLSYYNTEGDRIEDSRGVWETSWQVSNNGMTVIEERWNKDGEAKRFNNFLDFGRVLMEFDEDGLRVACWNIDENGTIRHSPKRKVAGVITSWNKSTLDEKSIHWVDVDRQQKDLSLFEVAKGNYGFSREHYEHDLNGNITALTKYDTQENLVAPPVRDYAYFRRIFDNYGFIIDQRYFDTDGLPTENTNGVAREEYIRNELGNPKEFRRYNLDGHLTNGTKDGYASIKTYYKKNDPSKPLYRLYLNAHDVEIKREYLDGR